MIKSVLITRFSDGLVLCQSNEAYSDDSLLQVRHKVKQHHSQVTSYTKTQQTPLKQIDYPSFGIYFKINHYVVFTVIVDKTYPIKLVNGFLNAIIAPFFDQVKCSLGAANYKSRLQSINSDHYFVRFDRTIKNKKKEFQDPSSFKNVQRMKKQLEVIHDIMKENMGLLQGRQQSLEATEERAKRISEQSKKFDRSTKKLLWRYWFRNNLIWIIISFTIVIVIFLIF